MQIALSSCWLHARGKLGVSPTRSARAVVAYGNLSLADDGESENLPLGSVLITIGRLPARERDGVVSSPLSLPKVVGEGLANISEKGKLSQQ